MWPINPKWTGHLETDPRVVPKWTSLNRSGGMGRSRVPKWKSGGPSPRMSGRQTRLKTLLSRTTLRAVITNKAQLKPVYRYRHHICNRHCLRIRLCQIYIVWMVTGRLTEKMGPVPNMPITRPVSINTILNFEGEGHEHGDGDGTCKQAFTWWRMPSCRWSTCTAGSAQPRGSARGVAPETKSEALENNCKTRSVLYGEPLT